MSVYMAPLAPAREGSINLSYKQAFAGDVVVAITSNYREPRSRVL